MYVLSYITPCFACNFASLERVHARARKRVCECAVHCPTWTPKGSPAVCRARPGWAFKHQRLALPLISSAQHGRRSKRRRWLCTCRAALPVRVMQTHASVGQRALRSRQSVGVEERATASRDRVSPHKGSSACDAHNPRHRDMLAWRRHRGWRAGAWMRAAARGGERNPRRARRRRTCFGLCSINALLRPLGCVRNSPRCGDPIALFRRAGSVSVMRAAAGREPIWRVGRRQRVLWRLRHS